MQATTAATPTPCPSVMKIHTDYPGFDCFSKPFKVLQRIRGPPLIVTTCLKRQSGLEVTLFSLLHTFSGDYYDVNYSFSQPRKRGEIQTMQLRNATASAGSLFSSRTSPSLGLQKSQKSQKSRVPNPSPKPEPAATISRTPLPLYLPEVLILIQLPPLYNSAKK